MAVPEGGFVHRMMPPTEFFHGEVPAACDNKGLGCREIEQLLRAEYMKPENFERLVAWLAERDGGAQPSHRIQAELQISIIAEIDAGTIWALNLNKECGNG